MPLVKNKHAHKRQLGDLKPGNCFRSKWDDREGFYIISKTNADPSIQTPRGKVLVVNLETGRAVFKPLSLMVEVINVELHIEDKK